MERVATCHTEDCDNAEIAITVKLVDSNTTVQCGVCGQAITDVAEP